ncbi:MAG: hypothetical protein IPJ79_20030 [Bacteroidetes bacterium]|nr:hypothetical protein [Bacteroidota bacterium]
MLGDFVIARYNVDGTVDSTFNNTGSIIVSAGYADQLHGMKLQNDGKIVASGYSSTAMGGPYNYFLIRVDTNGALDNTFWNRRQSAN